MVGGLTMGYNPDKWISVLLLGCQTPKQTFPKVGLQFKHGTITVEIIDSLQIARKELTTGKEGRKTESDDVTLRKG